MPDMKVFLELIAKSDKFQQGMQQGERALKGFQGFAQKTGQVITDLTQKFGFLGNAATALSTGLVLKKLFSIADYMPIDDALLRMRVNLKANSAEMDILKNKIAAFAGEKGQDIGQSFQVASKLSLTFKQDDMLQIMNTADKISKATGDPLELTSASTVEMIKLFKLSRKEVEGVGDALIASRINMEQLDTVMQRLALHGGGKKDYIESLGMIRGLGMAGIDKTRSIVALNNVLDMINNKGFILEQHGIKVKGRSQLEVLTDLEKYINKMRKTHSEAENLKQAESFFGAGGKEAMDFVFQHMKDFQKGIDEMGHASEIATGRAAAGMETWDNQLNRVKGHLGGIKTDLSHIYDLAKKPVKFMANHEDLTKAAGWTVAGLSVGVLVALAYGNIKNILKTVGKTGVGIAEGKAIEAATGITPVFVTNMPAAGILGAGGAAELKGIEYIAGLGLAAGAVTVAAITTAIATMGTAVLSFADALTGGSGKNWISEGAKDVYHGWWIQWVYDNFPSTRPEVKTMPDSKSKMPMIYNDEWKNREYPRGGDKSKMFELPENKISYLDMFGGKDWNDNLESLLHPEKPLIYNDAWKNKETPRGAEKNNFVFNFKFDKNGRITGDTDTPAGDVRINLERGDFGY